MSDDYAGYGPILEQLTERAESAERQLGETREALADLRETAAPRDWETPGHPMNEWTKREPILRKIDHLLARLAVSPADTTEGTG